MASVDNHLEKTKQLVECMESFNLYETADEKQQRREVLDAIDQLAQRWIRELSLKKNISSAEQCRVKIFTYGSHRLGVQNRGDDIDVLLVAPRHASLDDFFGSFQSSLSNMDGVGYVCCVRKAVVPIMKTDINGIKLDIAFAALPLPTIPQYQELGSVSLIGLGETTVRSLNGTLVADDILRLAPNKESFIISLRAIKLWAKKKGIYSQILGYFGGVSWVILVAYIVKLNPHDAASEIVQKLFRTFANWRWTEPVLLKALSGTDFGFRRWNRGRMVRNPSYNLMPIITPSYPEENSTFRLTKSARAIIIDQLKQANIITEHIMMGTKTWDDLFEPIDFIGLYESFLVITATPQPDWSSLVESKIRELVLDLEGHYFIEIAHAYPYSYTSSSDNPDVNWCIGIRTNGRQISMGDLRADIQNLKTRVVNRCREQFGNLYLTQSMDVGYVTKQELIALNVMDPKLIRK